MDREAFLDILDDVNFDDLPGTLQDEIEELSDRECIEIDEIWIEIKHGDYDLPRYIQKSLEQAVKKHILVH